MEAQLLLAAVQAFIAANGPTAPILTCDGFTYSGFVLSTDMVPGALVLDETGAADETISQVAEVLTTKLESQESLAG